MGKIILLSTILVVSFNYLAFPQEILFQDDFESYNTGTFPAHHWYLRWDGNGEENQIIVIDHSVSTVQSLKLECAPGWAAEVQVHLKQAPPVIYCEGYVMVDENDFQSSIGFYNPNIGTWGTIYAGVGTNTNGKIVCQEKELQSYESDKWYHLKLRYNSYLNICDVWVDNVLKGKDIACPTSGEYNAFGMGTYITSGSSRAWFDDVKVYADSLTMMFYTLYTGLYLYLAGESDSAEVYFEKTLDYPHLHQGKKTEMYFPVTLLKYILNSPIEFDSILINKHRAFDWFRNNGLLLMAMYVSNDLGTLYINNSEYNLAEKYYLQSERIFVEMISIKSCYSHDSLKFIEAYGTEHFYPLTKERMMEMMWMMGKTMYYSMFQIKEANNNIEKALNYHIAYSNAKDSLMKLTFSDEPGKLQYKYEEEQKLDNQIQVYSWLKQISFKSYKLKQTRLFLFGLGILVLLVVLLAIVFIRQNKLRNEQQNLFLQQRLYRSQMNPHFIFNSLASIQNFVVRQESKNASIYLSKFSELVRSILDSSAEEYIPFEKEKNTIENYLELQKVRFPDKFEYSIEVDEIIDLENMMIPPMLAQPFIENSIEHGFKYSKTKGSLKIRFSLNLNIIVIEIEDDGIGREKAKEIGYKFHKDHRSMATDITRERLMVLNKKLKRKISLIIHDLKNDENEPVGTKVVFDIPFKYV